MARGVESGILQPCQRYCLQPRGITRMMLPLDVEELGRGRGDFV